MRRVSSPRRPGPATALALLALAAGCTQHHYYYRDGVTPAYVVPGETVIIDDLCEIPSRSASKGSPTLVAGGSSSTTASSTSSSSRDDLEVVSSGRAPRVVISRPNSGPIAGKGWNALGRNDRVVTTEVQGGADPTSIR